MYEIKVVFIISEKHLPDNAYIIYVGDNIFIYSGGFITNISKDKKKYPESDILSIILDS